jgi:hypothetical protein
MSAGVMMGADRGLMNLKFYPLAHARTFCSFHHSDIADFDGFWWTLVEMR